MNDSTIAPKRATTEKKPRPVTRAKVVVPTDIGRYVLRLVPAGPESEAWYVLPFKSGFVRGNQGYGLVDSNNDNYVDLDIRSGLTPPAGITVTIDLKKDGPYAVNGGTLMATAVRKCAAALDAKICDAAGKEIRPSALDSLASVIDGVMADRDKQHLAARTITMANGEKRLKGELSFTHTVLREAGSRKPCHRLVAFDVPAVEFDDAMATGMKMARELALHIKSGAKLETSPLVILGAAFTAYRSDDAARSWAAWGFLSIVGEALSNGISDLYPPWINNQIARQEQHAERVKARKAENEKTRATGAAKKAARAA